ncbi:hypothetical protein BH09VER1_BH09VER1_39930 [soil metagenome]
MKSKLLLFLLACLLPTVLPLRAELKKETWRSAHADERLRVPAALSNIFFVFHTKKQIMAYAGGGGLDDSILSSAAKRKEFIEGVLGGIQRTGLVLKDQQSVLINKVPATEAHFFTPATEQTMLGVFCISGTRFVTLCVFSKDPLTFKDPEFTALVKELPIKQAPPFRTDSGTELRPADIAPIR